MNDRAGRVVFFGTSRFAVPSLESLVKSGYDVAAVVSQPARPAGRGRTLTPSAVALAAERLGLSLLTPEKLRAPDSVAAIAELSPDLAVVAAYAQILPRDVLSLPRFGCINVHASLLPRWRGASPMQAAILAGDEFTGVSIMMMEPSMDTGPVLAETITRIDDADSAPDLERRLSEAGALLLTSVLPCYLAGGIEPVSQDPAAATYAPLIRKEDGKADWALPARVIWRASRAYRPWPGLYSYWRGKQFKILSCRAEDSGGGTAGPGMVLALGSHAAAVATGDGVLRLDEVSLEGGRAMPIGEFLAGHRDIVGSRLE